MASVAALDFDHGVRSRLVDLIGARCRWSELTDQWIPYDCCQWGSKSAKDWGEQTSNVFSSLMFVVPRFVH